MYTYLSLGNRTIISIIGNPRTAEMAALPVSPEVPENQNKKIREIKIYNGNPHGYIIEKIFVKSNLGVLE